MANGNTNYNSMSGPVTCLDNMDTVEFRIMMAYARRRRPGDVRCVPQVSPNKPQDVTDTLQTTDEPVKRKKKRKPMKWFRKWFSCVTPETKREDVVRGEPESQSVAWRMAEDVGRVEENVGDIAERLTNIADRVAVIHGKLESDGEEGNSTDDVERLVGLLLREKGDQLNERILKDASLASELFGSYGFFEKVISTFLKKMGVPFSSPDKDPETKIALTCEVTTRLSAVGTHPMNQLMGFGARYLKNHFSTWATEKGGYEQAIKDEDEVN